MPSFLPTENLPLSQLSTMGVGGPARFVIPIHHESSLIPACQFAQRKALPVQVIGEGSNIVFSDQGFEGIIFQILQKYTNPPHVEIRKDKVRLTVPGWMRLDQLIEWCCQKGFSGMTCLSGIPGTVGAAPIQNVGAYGREIQTCIEKVKLFHRDRHEFSVFSQKECEFGYRSSTFQRKKHILISEVTFSMHVEPFEFVEHPQILKETQSHKPELGKLRDVVLGIRRSKGMLIESFKSCGSFFKNPLLTHAKIMELNQILNRPCPAYPGEEESFKVPAAFLIEAAGLKKGDLVDGVGLSPYHALSIIQDGTGKSTRILKFAQTIQARVFDQFGVLLEPEPLLLDPKGKRICL